MLSGILSAASVSDRQKAGPPWRSRVLISYTPKEPKHKGVGSLLRPSKDYQSL